MILSLAGFPAGAEQAADSVSLKGLSGSASSTAVIARESETIEGASSPGDPAVIDALLRRAEAYQSQGYLQEARRDASAAASAARARNDAERLARALGVTGAIEYMAGRTETARQAFGDSLELARANGDGIIEAATLLNIGNTWIDDDRQKAADAYAAAADRGEALGLSQIGAQAYLNLARFELFTVKDYASAASYLDRAENQIRQLADVHERGERLLALGILNRDLARVRPGGADGKAVEMLSEAAGIGRQFSDPRLESQAWGELAELDAREGKNDQALRRAEDALRLARAAEAPDLAYRWQRQIGRLRSADGDMSGAIAAYRETVDVLRPLRAEIAATTSAGGAEFRDTLASTYLEYADLLFRQVDQAQNAEAGQVLLGEARDALEQLRSAELENYFQNECIAELQSQRRALDWGTQGTAIVYPVIFPQHLVLLAEIAGSFHYEFIAVDAAAIRRHVERLRLMLSSPGSNDIASAKELYDLLVRPMQGVLIDQEVRTLVIVPDGVLRLVPWAALHDGQTYLGEKFAIAIAPSFELINPQPLKQIRPLVAALTESRPPWPPLKFIDEEIGEIERLFAATVLKNQAFVPGRLESSLNATPYSLVHIASHARFGQSARDSYIVTYDDRLDMNGLERAMSPSRFRDEPVELIILSACETAAGDEQAALGLAGVALKAGARSALASLWGTDDRATYQLVTEFYRSLAAGQSKAEALQGAQRHVRTIPGMEHPYYWASFVIIGNWL